MGTIPWQKVLVDPSYKVQVICQRSHAGDGRTRQIGAGTEQAESGDLGRPRFQHNGADVDRKTRDVIARIPADDLPRTGFRRLDGTTLSTDGRWALVSTSLTALVAG